MHKLDGIYRATYRGASTHMGDRTALLAAQLQKGDFIVDEGRSQLVLTRAEVERGWRVVSELLQRDGQHELASTAIQFSVGMQPPRS